MKRRLLYCIISLILGGQVFAQQEQPSVYKIPDTLLAGEGLKKIAQADSSRTAYQRKVFDGEEIAVYIVAIGTGITNTFTSFPMEEFIYWINGKAIVEPTGAVPFSIYSGDYFIQAKGFNGNWNFVDNGGLHLELALIAKNRPDSTFKSPINHAMVLDRDMLSGVVMPDDKIIYSGPELTLRLVTDIKQLKEPQYERMIHLLSGIVEVTSPEGKSYRLYPGDFFVVSESISCEWKHQGNQQLRVLEVHKTKLK